VRLSRGSGRIEITATIDNTVKDHRLRAVFPLGAAVESALADTTFGAIDRPVAIPSFWPFPSRDRPHRGFVDLRSEGRGLAVLSRGLYEHDVRPDGQLELTLLRCVGHLFIDFDTLEPRDPAPEGQCPGEHRFDYAIVPHDAQRPVESLAEEAAAFNAPLRVTQTDHHTGELPPRHSFLHLEPAALQLSAVKRAEDRETLILRCFNTTDQPVNGTLRVAGAWHSAYHVNLDEQRGDVIAIRADGTIAIDARPWEIVTLELDSDQERAPVA
jgi:alpha-mannosidase